MKQLHKVREGQPISARAYNDLIDAINEMRIIASDDILPKQQAGGQSLFIRPQVARGRVVNHVALVSGCYPAEPRLRPCILPTPACR